MLGNSMSSTHFTAVGHTGRAMKRLTNSRNSEKPWSLASGVNFGVHQEFKEGNIPGMAIKHFPKINSCLYGVAYLLHSKENHLRILQCCIMRMSIWKLHHFDISAQKNQHILVRVSGKCRILWVEPSIKVSFSFLLSFFPLCFLSFLPFQVFFLFFHFLYPSLPFFSLLHTSLPISFAKHHYRYHKIL